MVGDNCLVAGPGSGAIGWGMKRTLTVVMGLVAGLGAGCGGGYEGQRARGDERPAALVDGRPVSWERLKPGLAELAGGEVLEEVILDELLARRCAERGVVVEAEQVAAERALLIESLDASPDRAEELLGTIRASRKLGEARFAGALRRSAMLRALSSVDEAAMKAEVEVAVRLWEGERSVVRIISSMNEVEAAAARQRVTGGGNGVVEAMHFAAVAAEVSLDESAARGGLVGEVGALDTRVAAGLRDAVARTAVGHVTPVVATGEGFVIALVQERLPRRDAMTRGDVERVARETRVRMQRREMERLARELLSVAKVVPMDRALGWGWGQRGK